MWDEHPHILLSRHMISSMYVIIVGVEPVLQSLTHILALLQLKAFVVLVIDYDMKAPTMLQCVTKYLNVEKMQWLITISTYSIFTKTAPLLWTLLSTNGMHSLIYCCEQCIDDSGVIVDKSRFVAQNMLDPTVLFTPFIWFIFRKNAQRF